MASGIQIMFERSFGGYQRRRRGIALIAILFVALVAPALVDVLPASAAPPPTVSSVLPDAGSTSGGTSVTITGTGFSTTSGATTVDFATAPATGVSCASTTSCSATSPAGSGTVDVTVIVGGQTSATSGADLFSYGTPTVSAVSPDAGSISGGTAVTITGTDFASGTTVKFATTAATGVVVNSSTSISATSPASTGTVDVTVTTSNGTSVTSGSDLFLYGTAPPTVSAVSPDAGSTSGGTSVTITGTNFASGATVSFGGRAATSVTVVSSTSVTAKSPAGSSGTVDVTVTTSNGTSAVSGSDLFLYGTIPGVSAVSPDAGSTSGGTAVTITGTNFASGMIVAFGATAATGVTVYSSTSISATSPAGTGTVDVTVTTSNGTSVTSGADLFSYGAPTVTAVSPDAGSTSGGTAVTITGTNFASGATVSFGGTAATRVVVVSAASITATSPAGTGTVNVTVTTANGPSVTSGADLFSYGAPTVTAVFPDAGSTSGGTAVTITGTNFASGLIVLFGSIRATNVVFDSSTFITATSPPAGSGTVQVTVTTNDGTSAISATDLFTYGSVGPTVTAVSPDAGPANGGTAVTITGTNFASGATVFFGSIRATSVVVVSATAVTATSSAGTGTVDVTVSTSNGPSPPSGADLFSYGAPTVTAISPDAGTTSGGTGVTITGTNFASGATVSFGGTAATSVVVVSATSITATSPAGTGTVNLTVTTANGTSVTSSADQFGYGSVPSAPIDVQALATSGESLVDRAVVSWDPPSIDGGSPVISYAVVPFDLTTSTAGQKVVVTTITVTIGGLAAGDVYTFRVAATTLIGTGAVASSNEVVPVGAALDSYKQATSSSPRKTVTISIGRGGVRGSVRAEGTGKGTLAAGKYLSNPIPAIATGGTYYDLSILPGSAFSRVSVTLCGLPRGLKVLWWDAHDRGVRRAFHQSPPSGRGSCTTVTVTRKSAPNLGQLVGTVFVVPSHYLGGAHLLLAGANGAVHRLGNARFYGSLPTSDLRPMDPIAGIAALPDRRGYWLVTRVGGVFAFGDASFYGSLTTAPIATVVAIATTPDGEGYWLVDSTGGIYPFGDASFYGSLQSSGLRPSAPIDAIARTPDGKGYWLVDVNGGVSAYGDASFFGSTPAKKHRQISGVVTTPDGKGYWLVDANGEVFAFGDARRYGPISTGRVIPRASIVGVA